MASEMTFGFREFARKKLNEAKQRGASLANVTTASIANSVTSTSFVFRSNSMTSNSSISRGPMTVETKVSMLNDANKKLKAAVVDVPLETLEESISKLDSINESLAFTIENLQETAHVMSLASRQLKELESMGSGLEGHFYQKKTQDQIQDAQNETITSITEAIENMES